MPQPRKIEGKFVLVHVVEVSRHATKKEAERACARHPAQYGSLVIVFDDDAPVEKPAQRKIKNRGQR